ncbi:MAG: energy-coupling factor transporter transmembrane protein EcfT [Actinobacteria bacterium]|nr:energy-coupling factor transporter transmembrane protein EcfT [Actinomycetota bacterium]
MTHRALHPLAWWIWAGSLAIALAKSNSLLLSASVVGAVAIVVSKKSENAPWAQSFRWALTMGLWIVIIRIFVGITIGVPTYGRAIFTLPVLTLPTWMVGIRVGGPVTFERVSATAHEGFMLAAIIALLGAASSLSSPHRLLRSIPIMVYEFGVAVVIATSVLPQIVTSAGRIRQAQELRGQTSTSWRRIALPLLEDSLSRSLDLAAAMDSRGYGFSRKRSRYRPNSWTQREFLLIALGVISLIYPLVSVVTATSALLLAPGQERP